MLPSLESGASRSAADMVAPKPSPLVSVPSTRAPGVKHVPAGLVAAPRKRMDLVGQPSRRQRVVGAPRTVHRAHRSTAGMKRCTG